MKTQKHIQRLTAIDLCTLQQVNAQLNTFTVVHITYITMTLCQLIWVTYLSTWS